MIGAGIGGALLGGGLRAAANVLTRAIAGSWPTAALDAAHAVQSEANILNSNVLPGAEGEAAHSDALAQSIGQVLRGDPVDVSSSIPAESDFAGRIGDIPARSSLEDVSVSPTLTPIDDLRAELAAPEVITARRADLERAVDQAAQSGQDLQIPMDVDADGNPVWGRVADAIGDIDKYRDAAQQVMGCATRMAEAAE